MVEEFIQNLENHEKPNRKKRSKSYYRHHRNRSIKRKLKIAKFAWAYTGVAGKLSKGKIHCSCEMCRYEQRNGIPKAKEKIKEQEAEKEIQEYM